MSGADFVLPFQILIWSHTWHEVQQRGLLLDCAGASEWLPVSLLLLSNSDRPSGSRNARLQSEEST